MMADQPPLARAPEQPIETDLSMPDGIFAKSILVRDAFTTLPQHAHTWDHASLIAAGQVAVYEVLPGDHPGSPRSKSLGVFRAPAFVMIKAGVMHTFVTYEPNTVIVCLHRIDRTGEVEIEREHQIV